MEIFEFSEPFGPIVKGLVLTPLAVLWTMLLVRIVGLRAFSKMTAFDFVTTIATGSLIAQAGTRSDWPAFLQALAAIGAVFLTQWLLAIARQRSDRLQNLIKNKPVLLMEDGQFSDRAMEETRVARANIFEKLRQANVGSLSDVKAVVLETTGNISVMSRENFDRDLLEGVQRV
jgi:uncharacterized membrane protein YcaP (DUF421 family)